MLGQLWPCIASSTLSSLGYSRVSFAIIPVFLNYELNYLLIKHHKKCKDGSNIYHNFTKRSALFFIPLYINTFYFSLLKITALKIVFSKDMTIWIGANEYIRRY